MWCFVLNSNNVLQQVFKKSKPIIGMVHLKPLIGAPLYESMEKVIARAITDAQALEVGGVDGIIVENVFDIPFYPDRVPPETISAMTLVAAKVAENIDLPLGINVLRNDSISAMAIATVIEASFIRVNVLSSAYVTDQGIIQNKAYELLRYRSFLRSNVKIFADLRVKYAKLLVDRPICLEAEELTTRSLADAIIITGEKSGSPPDKSLIEAVRKCAKSPIIIGSGLTIGNLADYLPLVDGAIVGTYFKEDGIFENPVSVKRVKEFMELVESFR